MKFTDKQICFNEVMSSFIDAYQHIKSGQTSEKGLVTYIDILKAGMDDKFSDAQYAFAHMIIKLAANAVALRVPLKQAMRDVQPELKRMVNSIWEYEQTHS